jgi:hypothetical protein
VPVLDAALQRLGRATLTVLSPALAAQSSAALDEEAERRVAAEVDRLAGMLAR